MNKYLLPLIMILLIFGVSCGDQPAPKTEKPRVIKKIEPKNISENDKTENDVVDADEFSKAFSTTITKKDDLKKGEFVEDKSKFFKEGSLVQNKFTNQEFLENSLSPSSSASQVRSGKKYSWLPNWDFSGKGGVRLPDAALSSDKSLLAIIDNVSSTKDLSSSLVVVLNTSNFNIQTIYYYKGKLLKSIKFLPDSTKIVVWEEQQEEKGKGTFHLIDLRNGKISASSEMIKSSAVDFAIRGDGEEMVVKPIAINNRLFIFKLSELGGMPKIVECNQKDGRVAISPDNSLFALMGKETLEIFKFSDKLKLKEMKTGLEASPEDLIFVNGNNTFAMLSYMKPLYLMTDGTTRKICHLAGRKLFLRKDINSIVFEESKNKAISILDLKTLKKVDTFSPEKLKPRTLGSALLIGYLPHIDKYIVLDRKGNLSLFYRPGKRWRKRLIFAPGK